MYYTPDYAAIEESMVTNPEISPLARSDGEQKNVINVLEKTWGQRPRLRIPTRGDFDA